MVSNFAVYSGDTFFPDDIRMALNNVQDGRILITTPLHLRALINSGIEYPELSGVLCATSPLSAELAHAAENHLSTDLIEIYGCSEIGSMAKRRPAQGEAWRFFPEMQIRRTKEDVYVSTKHVPEGVKLSDTLSFNPDGSFVLEGRSADLIKVAGKRMSLGELNNRLLSIEGVIDGVFYEPRTMGLEDTGRLAALVVTHKRTAEDIRKALSEHIDPIFLPRPLRIVDQLPRMKTGKLAIAGLRELIQEASDKS
jgi:acyl-coenzyme A synthetase/AMP-(fatty) acid ligase